MDTDSRKNGNLKILKTRIELEHASDGKAVKKLGHGYDGWTRIPKRTEI